MRAEAIRPGTQEETRQPITAADYVAGIETYLADTGRDPILRPDQDLVFQDLQNFIRDGGTKGYVTAPTGTGKTVIFVEFSKALLEAGGTAGRPPRILVVEPTKDLVHQTLGRTGEKGYGKFAPGLHVASFFSDSTEEDRHNIHIANVAVTTYDSLAIMTRRQEMREQTEEEKDEQLHKILDRVITKSGHDGASLAEQLEEIDFQVKTMGKVPTDRKLLDLFDVIICDEAHYILGDTTASIVDSIGKDKLVLGFTATPDANEKKRLDKHLPIKIHDLTFKEAIALELLAPLAGIGIRSHIQVKGSDLFDKEGDYQEEKLAYLASIRSRNQLVAETAKTLVEHGFGTLVSCIAGGGARHARLVADELNRMGVSAAAIYGEIPSTQRNELYRQFEKGEIDVLTNIRILREGWDSKRAKAIVEASPTRSLISKRQRIGRIIRPGDVAVAVDILDDYDRFNPPLHVADLLDGEDIPTGEIFGKATPEQTERVASLVKALGQHATIAAKVPADYSKLYASLSEYQEIVGGRVASSKQGHFSLPEKISSKYGGVTDEIMTKLWQMKDKDPVITLGRERYNIRVLYDVGESAQLLREVPECDTNRAYVLNDERWLSAEGLVIGFSDKYPRVNAELMKERLQELGKNIAWRPLKQPILATSDNQLRKYELFKAYRADEKTIDTLDKQLQDYFEIIDMGTSK